MCHDSTYTEPLPTRWPNLPGVIPNTRQYDARYEVPTSPPASLPSLATPSTPSVDLDAEAVPSFVDAAEVQKDSQYPSNHEASGHDTPLDVERESNANTVNEIVGMLDELLQNVEALEKNIERMCKDVSWILGNLKVVPGFEENGEAHVGSKERNVYIGGF